MKTMSTTSHPTSEHLWPVTPLTADLTPSLPHLAIWRIPLDADLDLEEILGARARFALSDEEIARARRYVRASHGSLWAQSRAATRHILAAYTHTDPLDLTFVISARGKPSLHPRRPPHLVTFNLSHSGAMALLGVHVTRHPPGEQEEDAPPVKLGVDTERVDFRRDLHGIARRVFSPAEQAALQDAPDDLARRDRFYAIWTQKEAYIKALGEGMHLPLESFDVSHDLCDARLLDTRHEGASPPSSWAMIGGWLGARAYPFALCMPRASFDLAQRSKHTYPTKSV